MYTLSKPNCPAQTFYLPSNYPQRLVASELRCLLWGAQCLLEVRRRFVVGSGRPSMLMLVRSAAALATMRPVLSQLTRLRKCPRRALYMLYARLKFLNRREIPPFLHMAVPPDRMASGDRRHVTAKPDASVTRARRRLLSRPSQATTLLLLVVALFSLHVCGQEPDSRQNTHRTQKKKLCCVRQCAIRRYALRVNESSRCP